MPREDVEKIIRQEPLENLYDVGNELGRGKFAIVKKCTEKSTGEPFAVKVLKKRRRGKSCRDDILLEIDIMRQANEAREHPRIICLHEVFESSSEFHIVLELATGGELFRVIAIDPLPEDKAREVVHQIVDGVQHLHALNIVHLDLKPENILLYRKGSLDIKIADFGLSVQVKEGQEMKTLVGTAEYVSPEILNFEPLSTYTDMWSIGALTYALLTGYSPFQGESHQETFLNVSQCDYDFDDDIFDVVSPEAKDFIELLLIKAPRKRMTAARCLEHIWMKGRKNNLNSSTSSLDSALCLDSPSSVEPSPASSTSSSFSPAPSSTISHSNTATTSIVTTSSSPVIPFSQPEDMSEVNKKLAHISSLATSSISAPEASTSGSIKLRDDEGSPTSTASSTSTLKEAASSENIPVLAGDSESSARLGRESSGTPSEGLDPTCASTHGKVVIEKKPEVKLEVKPEVKLEVKPEVKLEVKPEVKLEVKPEVKLEVKPEIMPEVKPEIMPEVKPEIMPEVKLEVGGGVANGRDVKMAGQEDKPKLRDQGEHLDDSNRSSTERAAAKNSAAAAKRDFKDASKIAEEKKLDMILDGIKSGVGNYSRTKRTDYDVKLGRGETSKPSGSGSRFNHKLTSHSASQLPAASVSMTDSKEHSKPEKDSKGAVEDVSKNKNYCGTFFLSTRDPVVGSSSTGALWSGRRATSVKSHVESTHSVSPSAQFDETFQNISPIKERKRGCKSDSFDDASEIRDSLGGRYKVNGKSLSQTSSPTRETFLPAQEPKLSDGSEAPVLAAKLESPVKKVLSFDDRISTATVQQESSDGSRTPETRASEPVKEMTEKERKKLERMKRRGSVGKTIQKKMSKAKMVMNEERKSSTSDDSLPPVVTPRSLSSPHDDTFAKEPVIMEEELTSEAISTNQLSPKSSAISSAKTKYRPSTPEPVSPIISSAKLLHSPERRTRRKSEGMKPIERRLKIITPQGETLHEESHNEDEKEKAVTSTPLVEEKEVEDPPKEVEDPPKEVEDPPKGVEDPPKGVEDPLKEVEDPLKEVEDPLKEVEDTLKGVEDPLKEVEDPPKEVERKSDGKAAVPELDEKTLKSNERDEKNTDLVLEERADVVVRLSSSIDVISRPQSRDGFRRSANSSPVKDISSNSNLSSASASALSCTNEKMDRGEKASSRPSSRASSRPSSRSEYRQASSEKDSSVKSKPSSPVSTISRTTSSTKYPSCTANAFTSNSAAFTTEEARPYTSVLRRNESSKTKSSVSSFTRTPIEDAWRYESSTVYTPSRRLSANPVRGRGADFVDVSGRTSPSLPRENSEVPQSQGEKESRRNSKVTSGTVSLGGSDRTKEKGSVMSSVHSVSPVSGSSPRVSSVTDSGKVEAKFSKADGVNESSPMGRFGSPRRAYVKREEMEDTGLLARKDPSSECPPATASDKDSTKGPSHSILDTTGPEIVVRTPSVSDATNLSPPPPPASSPTPQELSPGDVVIRRKTKLANPKRTSWRQTPVISPDVLDMILKGEIFDSDDERLETCVEVNEEYQPLKKFVPSDNRPSSQNGKYPPILKSSKPSSPENGHVTSKTSTLLLSEKKVSISEDTSWISYQGTRQRKFLSTSNRSYTDTSLDTDDCSVEDSVDRRVMGEEAAMGTISPLPDPLSISMDMRSDSLSRLRSHSLSHSCSTPDLTQIGGKSKKETKAKRVERSNSKRQFGRVRVDTYLDATSQRSSDGHTPTSPSRRSGTVNMSPRHSTSLTSRIKSSFSRWGDRDNKGARTLK